MSGTDPEKDSYTFLKETVRPSYARRMMIFSTIFLIASGILLGIAISYTAGTTMGVSAKDDTGKLLVVSSSSDNPGAGTVSGGSAAEGIPAPQITSVGDEWMKKVAKQVLASSVHVTSMKKTEDWFSVEHETDRNANGTIVAQTEYSFLILTDQDVISGMHTIYVTFPDGEMAEAKPVRSEEQTRLAVISVIKKELSETTRRSAAVAELSESDSLVAGDPIVAIGSPLGYSDSVAFGELTSVSETAQTVDGEYRLCVTGIVGSEDSSGVLADQNGRVVGCISRKYTEEGAQVVTAVRMADLIGTVRKLTADEPVGYAGITGETVSKEVSDMTGVPEGVFVHLVENDSPALNAGIAKGDVITSFDGESVSSMTQIRDCLLSHDVGDHVAVQILRSGSAGYVPFTFTIIIGENN